MGETPHRDRTARHTLIVVVLTTAGLATSYAVMRPEAFMERVLTFALGVLLAFMMMMAIERFDAEPKVEEHIHLDPEHGAVERVAVVPPPPSPEQWSRLRAERSRSGAGERAG
jgi:hypothetical protein